MNKHEEPPIGGSNMANLDVDMGSSVTIGSYKLRSVLDILIRRKKWLIAAVLVGLFVSVVYLFVTPPSYDATAIIELNKSNGGMSLSIGDVLGGQLSGANDLQVDLQTETEVLQGDTLILSVIKSLSLDTQKNFIRKGRGVEEAGVPLEKAPIKRSRLLGEFRKHLKVQPIHGTRLIAITFNANDSKLAANIANSVIENYKTQYLQTHFKATSEVSSWLEDQLAELKKNVQGSEERLTSFERQTGLLSLPNVEASPTSGGGVSSVHSTVIQKLDMLNTELTAAETARIAKEAVYRLVSSGSEEAILGLSQDPVALQSKSVVLAPGGGLSNYYQLQQQRNQLRVAIAQANAVYGPDNRRIKDLETQERATQEQMRSEIREIVRSANGDYLLAKHTENAIRQRFEAQQAEAAKLNEKAVELAVLSQEATSSKKLYEDLYSKLQESNITSGIKSSNITVVNPARVQAIPVSPKGKKTCMVGLGVGLMLGVLLVFVVDMLDSSVDSPYEVERITSVPVIGVVPMFNEQAGKNKYIDILKKSNFPKNAQDDSENHSEEYGIWLVRYPKSAGAEAIRSVRTSIMLSVPNGGPKTLLVTSCFPGEGKSTLTANIAASFVLHGKSVVIVEADMRRPSMKHVLNVDNSQGLSNVLSGINTLDEVLLHNVKVDGLDVLPAGPQPPLPSELIGAKAFDTLLNTLTARYDLVIVDSPPALLLTDATQIAAKVDAVVWVSLAGVVKRQQLVRASQLIARNSMPVIGFVFNRASSAMSQYGYDYGYGYDSYYGSESYYSESRANND